VEYSDRSNGEKSAGKRSLSGADDSIHIVRLASPVGKHKYIVRSTVEVSAKNANI